MSRLPIGRRFPICPTWQVSNSGYWMNISLTNKAALVTGAGRGIGRAIAESLVASGASVLLADIDESALEETRLAVSRSKGSRIAAFTGDLTTPGVPETLIKTLIEEFGSIDIIVNNAGYTWDNVIQKTTDEQFQAMLDIHVVTPFRILRAAAPWIREKAKAEFEAGSPVVRKVVNITSI